MVSYRRVTPLPPEQIMLAMAEKMESLLAAAPDPLSFVVIVPAWTEVPAWKALTASRFRQAEVWHRPSSSVE